MILCDGDGVSKCSVTGIETGMEITYAGTDGDVDMVELVRLGTNLNFTGTDGNGDKCSSTRQSRIGHPIPPPVWRSVNVCCDLIRVVPPGESVSVCAFSPSPISGHDVQWSRVLTPPGTEEDRATAIGQVACTKIL